MQDTNRRSLSGHLRSRHHRRGQALVEFALVVPTMLLLLVIAIDFGRLFATYVAVSNAAREGAAYASINPTYVTSANNPDPNNVTYRARLELANPTDTRFTALTVGSPVCTPAPCPAYGTGGGAAIKVTVQTTFTFFTPIISAIVGSSLQIVSSATAVIL